MRANRIHDNHASGYGGGIFAEESHDLAVMQCEVSGNTAGAQGGGLALVAWCTAPQFSANTIVRNSAADGGGVYCYYMSSPTISGNQISTNVAAGRGGGIFCETACTPAIDANLILGNQALIGGGLYMMNSQPTITSCTITENDESGIHFTLGWAGHVPAVHENSIAGNAGYGVRNDDEAVPVAAENNWWGDPTGPHHPTQNPGGLGDRVGDSVVFTPWLLDPGEVTAVEEPGGETQPGGGADPGHPPTSGLRLTCTPNPFEGETTIDFSVPGGLAGARARLAVYDVAGRLVRAFSVRAGAGGELEGRFVWRGDDERGAPVPRGVHYVRLEAESVRAGTRVIRLR